MWLGVSSLSALSPVEAQQPAATADPDAEFTALMTSARQFFAEGDWDRSAADYQAMVAAARARKAELWEGRGILGLGRIANEQARYTDARRHAVEALAIFERLSAANDVGDANTTLGVAADAQNENATASTHYERAAIAYRTAGNERAAVEARFRLHTVAAAEGSLDPFGQLQAEAHALGDRVLEGEILHVWGDRLFARSIYQEAIEKLDAAAALLDGPESRSDLGTVYNSLGRLYRVHGQPAAALEFQLKALRIHETTNRPRDLIQSLNSVGVAAQMAGDMALSRTHYERALAAAEASGVRAYIDFMRANLGAFLIQTDTDVDRGRELIERAMASDQGYTTSGRYTQLADAYRRLGRPGDARVAADRALSTCRTPVDCIYARSGSARTYVLQGNDTAALAEMKELFSQVEKLHGSLAAADFLRQNFTRVWGEMYSVAIEMHFRRQEYREALEASEMARSRAFVDLIASREARRSTAAPPAAPAIPLRGAPAAAAAPSATALRSDLSVPPPKVDDLAAIASRLRSTLLAYWVGDSEIYIWALSVDGKVQGASAKISRAKLDELVRQTMPFASPSEKRPATVVATRGEQQIAASPATRKAWRALYDLLIAPIEAALPRAAGARLTIVPHGPLLGVPFAALLDARGRYLVERYTIHSVPAAAVLSFTSARVRDDARGGAVLLVGDPSGLPRVPGDPPLGRLAGAGDEVRAIGRLLPAARATMLSGSAATEPRVRAALAGKDVIHFATHAIVRDSTPLASFLALGTGSDGAADGQFTVDEIYGHDLDANLIVLSACRSGGGALTGDGVAGLARAFFYSGAASVIVSLWDVADQPTNRLLPAFYRQWLKGADKASALRAAQLALIRDLRAGVVKVSLSAGTFVLSEDPVFWAPFVLLGEPE